MLALKGLLRDLEPCEQRCGLSDDGISNARSLLIAGFRPFRAANPKLVTNEQIDQLRDQDGLRIMSQPAYPNHRPVAQVAERLEEAFNHASHVFWPEQISLLKKGLVRWERMPR